MYVSNFKGNQFCWNDKLELPIFTPNQNCSNFAIIPSERRRGPEGTEETEQSLKESEEIQIHLKSNSNIYTGPFGQISVKNGNFHFWTSILDPSDQYPSKMAIFTFGPP